MTIRTVFAPPSSPAAPRDDWLSDGILSGFIATFAMTVVLTAAYGLAAAIGDRGGSLVQRWFWALTDNALATTSRDNAGLAVALNLLVGMVWALVYGRVAEPAPRGPGWWKGARFALAPWLLSVMVFLPATGGGFLGSGLGAGPLPVLGYLVLHLVYGLVLGTVYGIPQEAGVDGEPVDRARAAATERGAAIGIVTGAALGAAAGLALGIALDAATTCIDGVVIGGLIGGAVGAAAGSFFGLSTPVAAPAAGDEWSNA